ncbi:MAG: TOTE conflict system archaeo-eukaryotic primase domain-containing protein [Candidatus Acidiferrales bacterium]
METAIKATSEIVRDYSRLFVNRGAYTLQSSQPHPERGRHHYFRPKAKGTGEVLSLTATTIRRHLEGQITIGLYAINPSTQRSKWVAIDADYAGAMEDLLKLQYFLQEDKVDAALEMSKRGGHLWIFMERPALARGCRIYIYNLALKLGVRIRGAGLAEGIEIFPKHDELRAGEFGNAIRGPLGIHRGANRRYWFYGADYDLEKQIAYLNRLQKLSEEHLRGFVAGKTMPPEFERKRNSPDQAFVRNSGHEFRILDHVDKVRKVGRNYVTRCPSCAVAGQDRSGDNLAVSIEDPRKYLCWAGCRKEMIRLAVGCPHTCSALGARITP